MSARREFLRSAYTFLFAAACSPDKLFGPSCTTTAVLSTPAPASLTDVYISSGDLDAKLPNPTEENLAIHLSGAFTTRGRAFANWNLGKAWTVDGNAEIALDGIAEMGGQPFYCLAGPARNVSGLSLRGNHSRLAASLGQLRTGGVLLYGDGQIDAVTFRDFGSKGAETFVAAIVDGQGPAGIRSSLFTDFNPLTSDTQVSVYFIAGDRTDVLMEENETYASGAGNWVQGHTIYQARKGLVRRNRTYGARTGYYGDFFATKGIAIERNQFLGCEHGVQLQLSPTGDGSESFSHEDYTIGQNEIDSSLENVALDTLGPTTPTRFIRGISIDPSLSLRNNGATGITREATCRRAA